VGRPSALLEALNYETKEFRNSELEDALNGSFDFDIYSGGLVCPPAKNECQNQSDKDRGDDVVHCPVCSLDFFRFPAVVFHRFPWGLERGIPVIFQSALALYHPQSNLSNFSGVAWKLKKS